MSQTEIIEEIKKLSPEQKKLVVEEAMKLLKDEEQNALRRQEREELRKRMAQAAERLKDYYGPGSEHVGFEALDDKDFHEER